MCNIYNSKFCYTKSLKLKQSLIKELVNDPDFNPSLRASHKAWHVETD